MKAIVLFVLLLCPLYATDRYVALNGNDANSGTLDSPFKTIQKGVLETKPGDRLFLRLGNHPIRFPVEQSADAIQVLPFPGEYVTLTPLGGTAQTFEGAMTSWSLSPEAIEKALTIPVSPDRVPKVSSNPTIQIYVNGALLCSQAGVLSFQCKLDLPKITRATSRTVKVVVIP